MEENKDIILFENNEIRRIEYKNEIYYSVVDIVGAISESKAPRQYWNDLKKKLLNEENFQLSEKILQLKLKSSDGKKYSTDVATRETIFRIIQSISSPNAEPFKLWFAKLAEVTTTEIHKTNNSQGVPKLKKDAQKGGKIAGDTRKNIEKQLGKPVLTSENANDFRKKKSLKSPKI